MIGALAYFGVLDASSLLPNKCTFSSEFQCSDWYISSASNSIQLKVRNNVGEPIFANLSATAETAIPLSCSHYNLSMGTAQQINFNLSNCNLAAAGFLRGEKSKVLLTMRYYTIASGSGYPHQVSGELYAVVE
jgi:hypothetical protein